MDKVCLCLCSTGLDLGGGNLIGIESGMYLVSRYLRWVLVSLLKSFGRISKIFPLFGSLYI